MGFPSGQTSILCADIGGTSTKAGVLNAAGELALLDSIPTRAPDGGSFANSLCDLIDRVRKAALTEGRQLSGLAVAIAGFLDSDRARMVYNSNIPWLENFPLRDHLAQRFDMRVELEVDSNAACMAEYCFGSGRGSHRFLCLAAGTGLGVGMAVDGLPLRFAYECLGDIGHIIVQPNGPLCTCGGRGCAEILISAPVLAERYRKKRAAGSNISLRDVISAAFGGDDVATCILREAGEWLGIAAASMANAFLPDRIAIAGGLSAAGDLVLKPAEHAFYSSASEFARSRASFCRAALGPMATLTGAGWPFLAEKPATAPS
ncbi:MAG: ROK family protein [Bryobacteraceae bacterium]